MDLDNPTPHSSELRSHSQTVPYLRREPAKYIINQAEKQKFLDHIFPGNDALAQQDLDFNDLRYDSAEPRKAEGAVTDKLNKDISSTSKNVFVQWPSHAPPGLSRDHRIDIAVISRNHPVLIPFQSQTNPVCLDVTDIQSCVEHTVTSGSDGRAHNKQHAYAKINELLKCPMNMSIITLGIHGSGMTLWYADRCGVIEVDMGTDKSLRNQAVRGLSNISPLRDPCVSVHRLEPRRIYEFRLHTNVYYGVYGSQGEALYATDGIACRGTLVLAGYFNTAQASGTLAIKLSHPAVPWATQIPYRADHMAGAWEFEWQVLQSLKGFGVRNVPEVVDHIEHTISTKAVREAAGLQDKFHRTRTILVTRPLAQCTLQGIESTIELPMLVQVMNDVIDAHEDAWRKAAIAHCDISLGNIQILNGRGTLADWEFGTPLSQLSTDRATNSGTINTMPPRLAYYRLKPSSLVLRRTIWDEVCSMYLCFISPLITRNETESLLGELLDRMLGLCRGDTTLLLTRYRSNPTVTAAMKNAVAKLFVDKEWLTPPHDADSPRWWDTLRCIVDSFVVDPIFI